jgi:hypothetical protein
VFAVENGHTTNFVYFESTTSAAAMEQRVTALHREYPAPQFRTVVQTER